MIQNAWFDLKDQVNISTAAHAYVILFSLEIAKVSNKTKTLEDH
jgi:hypothetical protein